MFYLIGKIIVCLFIAALFGFFVGWLFSRKKYSDLVSRLGTGYKNKLSGLEMELKKVTEKLQKQSAALMESQKENYRLNESLFQKANALTECEKRNSRLNTKLTTEGLTLLQQAGAAAPSVKTAVTQRDDLKEIWGIGKFLEGRLNELGIYTFQQIADWDKTEINRISKQIGPFKNRILDDDWVTQAKEKSKIK